MRLVANTILFIFEGERTERLLLQSFQRFYFQENGRSLITATYNTTIYSLYRELKNDEFLDIVEILRERTDNNRAALEGIGREDISEIYLFFDHDGHANNANDEKLQQLLQHFDEETDQGKLYISYPMVEAIKHLSDGVNFQSVTATIADNQRYKGLVSNVCSVDFRHLHELEQVHWHRINKEHCMKAWDLIHDAFIWPEALVSQQDIFNMQLEKHIEPQASVAVLSAFPLLLLDYYGVSRSEILCGESLSTGS